MYNPNHSLEGRLELRVSGQIEMLVSVDAGSGVIKWLECPWEARDNEIVRRETGIARSLNGVPNPLKPSLQAGKLCPNRRG